MQSPASCVEHHRSLVEHRPAFVIARDPFDLVRNLRVEGVLRDLPIAFRSLPHLQCRFHGAISKTSMPIDKEARSRRGVSILWHLCARIREWLFCGRDSRVAMPRGGKGGEKIERSLTHGDSLCRITQGRLSVAL